MVGFCITDDLVVWVIPAPGQEDGLQNGGLALGVRAVEMSLSFSPRNMEFVRALGWIRFTSSPRPRGRTLTNPRQPLPPCVLTFPVLDGGEVICAVRMLAIMVLQSTQLWLIPPLDASSAAADSTQS